MRIIPKKTKVATEFFKGMSLSDVIVGFVGVLIAAFILVSNLPFKLYLIAAVVLSVVFLLLRLDDEPVYVFLLNILRHCFHHNSYEKKPLVKLTEEDLEEEERLSLLPPKERKEVEKEMRRQNKKLAKNVKKQEKTAKKKLAVQKKQENAKKDREEKQLKQGTEGVSKSRGKKAKKENKAGKADKADIVQKKDSVENPAEKKKPRSRKSIKIAAKSEAQEKARQAREAQNTPEALAAREESRIARFEQKLVKKESRKKRMDTGNITPFTNISDQIIHYNGEYYGAVIELPAIEFRFFSEHRQDNAIDHALGGVLRNLPIKYSANLVKVERPVIYDEYIDAEYKKIDSLNAAYVNGLFTEEELKRRIEVAYDRINYLNGICFDNKVILPFFYLVLFDSDPYQLTAQVNTAISTLETGEMKPRRLNDKEIAIFLKYTNQIDFDEREIDSVDLEDYVYFAMPDLVDVKNRTVEVNGIITHNMRVISYPTAVGNGWGAYPFDTAGTKVVMKMKPIDRGKSIRAIDRSIDELRSQENATNKSSKLIELSTHIDTLSELLVMLQNDNETLLEVNIYVTAYDIVGTMSSRRILKKPIRSVIPVVPGLKKTIRRIYSESGMKIRDLQFEQMEAFIGSQVSAYDPKAAKGRDIHSGSAAAAFPFIYSYLNDKGGINLGRNNGVPVFIDFFRRDGERVNSNMVIIGKSGSGKSFATKTLLSNLAAENGKIFVLDPENEYTELAHNLGGKIINVGNSSQGRLNPFQIITNLEDDETEEGSLDTGRTTSTSFSTHLQFLEEFFHQILPDIESDAMEYLNNLIIRVYSSKGIDEYTELSELDTEDYPIFDDLYDVILEEFQSTRSDYLRANLQILMNYIAKFSTGGRNAALWNGNSTISTEENFIVFNFQSLLANRNNTVANAQMLLVLKWLDNEIIKNRDYNTKYSENRKIVVVIDEAHVFIDTKYPLALDFMFQLAKRIRKYNGMQIVITQNIKDFVGSEEIARKSTAIINACQYSLIFALAPNDMHDLCKLYEKAGEINEREQEQIINAKRGQAFVITSPSSRSALTVDTPEGVRHLFSDREYASAYFTGTEGDTEWEKIIQVSRRERAMRMNRHKESEELQKLRVAEGRKAAEKTNREHKVKIIEMDDDHLHRQTSPRPTEIVIPEHIIIPNQVIIPEAEPILEPVIIPEPEPIPEPVIIPDAGPISGQAAITPHFVEEEIRSGNIDQLLSLLRQQVKEEILNELESQKWQPVPDYVKEVPPSVSDDMEEEWSPEIFHVSLEGEIPDKIDEEERIEEERVEEDGKDKAEDSESYDWTDIFNSMQDQSASLIEAKEEEARIEEEQIRQEALVRPAVYAVTLEELMEMKE